MADIGGFHKITNLWPARPSRAIEQFGLRKKNPQNQGNKQHKEKQNENKAGRPGNHIDEYV